MREDGPDPLKAREALHEKPPRHAQKRVESTIASAQMTSLGPSPSRFRRDCRSPIKESPGRRCYAYKINYRTSYFQRDSTHRGPNFPQTPRLGSHHKPIAPLTLARNRRDQPHIGHLPEQVTGATVRAANNGHDVPAPKSSRTTQFLTEFANVGPSCRGKTGTLK